MPFLQSFTFDTDRVHPFPYNISAVKYAKNVQLNKGVTLFIGDNGCGKSTLLETLALTLNLPLIGGFITDSSGFEAARILKPFMQIERKRSTSKGFFFRAEDFSDFINSIDNTRRNVEGSLSDLKGVVDDAIIKQMGESMNYTLHNIRKNYGDDMQAYSHGEAYLKILQTRIGDKGIFLLDEPEAALSPLKQIALIFFIIEILKKGTTQFIISTHSPILMGIPGATIYEIREEGMEEVDYKETDHYRITKTFLTNPDYYFRNL